MSSFFILISLDQMQRNQTLKYHYKAPDPFVLWWAGEWRVILVSCFLVYSEESKLQPKGSGPLIVQNLTHKQGNMGVPLPRGLRCQGSAWHEEVGHCPESQGWKNQDTGGGEGSGRCCSTTEVRVCGKRRTEGERSRGGEFTLSPPQRPPGDGKICSESKSLQYSVLF